MAQVAIPLILAGVQMGLQYLMTPREQQSPVDKGKLDDIRITSAEYGAFIPRLWGKARMGGNIIWSTGISHNVIEYPSQGGKGIPQAPATRTHFYRASFGMIICRSEVTKFGTIWADADVVAGFGGRKGQFEAEDATLSGTASIKDPDYSASGGKSVINLGKINSSAAGKVKFNVSVVKAAPPRDEEIETTATNFIQVTHKNTGTKSFEIKLFDSENNQIGTTQTVSVDDTGGNWNVKTVIVRTNNVGGNDNYFASYVEIGNPTNPAPDIDKIAITKEWTTKLPNNSPEMEIPVTGFKDPYAAYDPASLNPTGVYDYAPTYSANGVATASGLPFNYGAFYRGTNNQPVDSYFKDYLDTRYGTGNGLSYAPASRGMAMAVFADYELRQGRIPNWTFELWNDKTTLDLVLTDLMTDCGLSATDYDVSNLSGEEFVGIVEASKISRRSFIENLSRYFAFRIAEIDGKIKTIPDSFTSIASIDSDLLRAHAEGSETPAFDCELLVKPQRELPQEIRFSVLNPLMDYHNETVIAFLSADVSSADSQEYNFPIVDYTEQARQRAEYFLLKQYAEYRAIEFHALPEMLKYAPGDVVTVNINGEDMLVRIEKMSAGLPIGIVKVEAIAIQPFDPTEIETTVSGLSTVAPKQVAESLAPRNSKAIPIISEPIRQGDKGRLGAYIAVTPMGQGVSQNIALYKENGADNFVIQDILDVPATCGIGIGTLGNYTGMPAEDTSNYLDIYFYNNASLESVTAGDLTRYPTLNLIRVGGEWLQFRTATAQTLPTGSSYRSKWRISNLTRGLFGTSGATTGHGSNEDVVLFTNNLKFYDLDPNDVNEVVSLKTTTGGQDIADVPTTSFTFEPVSKYTISNANTDRTFDADSTTINELADVVATIIDDLKL